MKFVLLIVCSIVFQSCLNKAQDNLVMNFTVDTDSTIDYEVFITEQKKKLDSIQDSGIHTIYLYNSKNDFTGSIQFFENDSMYYIGYYSTGEKWVEGELNNYKLQGEWKEYYKSGNIKTIRNINNGYLNGKFISYYENGRIESKTNYKMDKMHGDFISYYSNGNAMILSTFNEGKENGEVEVYYENSVLSYTGLMIEGNESGRWTYWDQDGKLTKIEYYDEGELIKTEEY